MNTAISLDQVSHHFKNIIAVDNLSLTIHEGETFGLLGPNGAGKTTVINLITGLLHRQDGKISVKGFDPRKQSKEVRKRIGLVPQETNVYEDLNAFDNLLHHAALYCSELSNIEHQIETQLQLFELWERRTDAVRTFSGGMRRRLALSRALLHNPEIIFFDEPTLGVDVQGRHVLWDHIKIQSQEGKTFIISTNDMLEADTLCDRLVILDHGKAIALDAPEKLKSDLGRDIISLQTDRPLDNPEAFFSWIKPHGLSIPKPNHYRFEVKNGEGIIGDVVSKITSEYRLESFHVTRPTLDDVFLHHTGRALRE
jgi:ABC-2 type transport system ATP-binding protein